MTMDLQSATLALWVTPAHTTVKHYGTCGDPTPATSMQGKRPPTGGGAIYLQDPHRKPSQVSNGGLGVDGVLGALGKPRTHEFAFPQTSPLQEERQVGGHGDAP